MSVDSFYIGMWRFKTGTLARIFVYQICLLCISDLLLMHLSCCDLTIFLQFHLTGELKNFRNVVAEAKAKDVKVVPALVKRMLDRNMFLFGFVDVNESSAAERLDELTEIQNASIQIACKKYVTDTFPATVCYSTVYSKPSLILLPWLM